MTEAEWLECTNPNAMLEFVRKEVLHIRSGWFPFRFFARHSKPSRKLSLFAVACVRRIWNLVPEGACRCCVEIGEQFAEGQIDRKKLTKAREAAETVMQRLRAEAVRVGWPENMDDPGRAMEGIGGAQAVALSPLGGAWAANAAAASFDPPREYRKVRLEMAAAQAAVLAACTAAYRAGQIDWWSPVLDSETKAQSSFLRDMFGNPFHPVPIQKDWLTANVVSRAEAIYTQRAFDRVPVLVDALEDTGCDNADILNHCRQPGEHARGCWVVDLLLGKE